MYLLITNVIAPDVTPKLDPKLVAAVGTGEVETAIPWQRTWSQSPSKKDNKNNKRNNKNKQQQQQQQLQQQEQQQQTQDTGDPSVVDLEALRAGMASVVLPIGILLPLSGKGPPIELEHKNICIGIGNS